MYTVEKKKIQSGGALYTVYTFVCIIIYYLQINKSNIVHCALSVYGIIKRTDFVDHHYAATSNAMQRQEHRQKRNTESGCTVAQKTVPMFGHFAKIDSYLNKHMVKSS